MALISAALSLVEQMDFPTRLVFNERLASLLAGSSASAAPAAAKAGKKASAASSAEAGPKRALPMGMLAWKAWVKHAKETWPEDFAACTKEPERLQVAKAIREANEDLYKEFVAAFTPAPKPEAKTTPSVPEDRAAQRASGAPEDKLAALRAAATAKKAAASAPTPAPAAAPSQAERLAALKANAAAAKAAKVAKETPAASEDRAAQRASGAPQAEDKMAALRARVAAKKAAPAPAPSSPGLKPISVPAQTLSMAAAAGGGGATTPPAEVSEEAQDDDPLPRKAIKGTAYFFDAESDNALYAIEADGSLGSHIGVFQPGNAEQPILFA
jgi:hypothetical protein